MFSKAKIFFGKIILIFCAFSIVISLINGECIIRIPEDPLLRPSFLLTIGSRKVDLVLKNDAYHLTLFENQEMEAKCDTTFENFDGVILEKFKNKIYIKCHHGLQIKTDERQYAQIYSSGVELKCSSQKWNLYETNKNFVWCPSNTTSYLLARPMELTGTYQYLAGICYDTFHLSLKSIHFTLTPKHSNKLHPTALTDLYKPSLEIKYLKETFGMKSVRDSDYDNHEIQDWIRYSRYNYSFVTQNSFLANELNQLGSLVDLVWWPNLRLGNWRLYGTALTKHIESQHQSYDILSGVSAVAAAPIQEACETNFTLTELTDYRNHKIPLYVWDYLRSTSNSSDEIVIIGFNSPFYEFYRENDVVFCPDKCQEVPWLKKISTTFRYSALGVIFCCQAEDVKASKRLDGFHDLAMGTRPQKTIETNPLIKMFEEEMHKEIGDEDIIDSGWDSDWDSDLE